MRTPLIEISRAEIVVELSVVWRDLESVAIGCDGLWILCLSIVKSAECVVAVCRGVARHVR